MSVLLNKMYAYGCIFSNDFFPSRQIFSKAHLSENLHTFFSSTQLNKLEVDEVLTSEKIAKAIVQQKCVKATGVNRIAPET